MRQGCTVYTEYKCTDLLNILPPDDGSEKGKFKVKRLLDVPTSGYGGPILDFADTSNPTVCDVIVNLPTKWLTFYTCIWPSALPFEMELEAEVEGSDRKLEIVYIGEDLLMEGGDYEELDRTSLPVTCTCNGKQVHPLRAATAKTEAHLFELPVSDKHLHIVWDVEDRSKVTVRCVPVPVADVRVVAKK